MRLSKAVGPWLCKIVGNIWSFVFWSNGNLSMLPCIDKNHMVLLSDEWITQCCLAADYWAIVVVLRSMCGATFSWGLGKVTALVNTVCSCCSCNYRSWEGTRVNHVIFIKWSRDTSIGCFRVMWHFHIRMIVDQSALPWWNTAIMMHNEVGWIVKHMKAIEGMVTLISRINPWILSIQSLEAHQHIEVLSCNNQVFNSDDCMVGVQMHKAVKVKKRWPIVRMGMELTKLFLVPTAQLLHPSLREQEWNLALIHVGIHQSYCHCAWCTSFRRCTTISDW